MAVYSGKSGTVNFDTTPTISVISWSLEMSVDEQDATAMTDAWASNLAGFQNWTANVEVRAASGGMEPTIADLGVVAKTLVLGSGSVTYTITAGAMVTAIGHSQDIDGTPTVTYTFRPSANVSPIEA